MAASLDTFNAHRPRLFAIAYRMLGSRAAAEDVLQDAYVRWHQSDTSELRSTEAWLVTSVTRLSIDQLRAAKVEREAACDHVLAASPMVVSSLSCEKVG